MHILLTKKMIKPHALINRGPERRSTIRAQDGRKVILLLTASVCQAVLRYLFLTKGQKNIERLVKSLFFTKIVFRQI